MNFAWCNFNDKCRIISSIDIYTQLKCFFVSFVGQFRSEQSDFRRIKPKQMLGSMITMPEYPSKVCCKKSFYYKNLIITLFSFFYLQDLFSLSFQPQLSCRRIHIKLYSTVNQLRRLLLCCSFFAPEIMVQKRKLPCASKQQQQKGKKATTKRMKLSVLNIAWRLFRSFQRDKRKSSLVICGYINLFRILLGHVKREREKK